MQYRGYTLDHFQAQSITYIELGHSVLVSAPTGTGKTIIADWVVEQALAHGNQVVYTAPIKALSNQKYRDYTRLYGKDAIGLVTGDLVINQDAPIRIMTTEILRNILLQQGTPDGLTHVIVDEIHFLDDPERGTVWEELLIYLPSEVKIVGLSATLSNIEEFSAWLSSVRGEDVKVIIEETRAVPLKVMMANKTAGLVEVDDFRNQLKAYERKTGKSSKRPERGRRSRRGPPRRGDEPRTSHYDLVRMLYPDYLPILFFVFSRRQTESFARELGRRRKDSFLSREAYDEVAEILRAFSEEQAGVLTDEHADLYLKGIAFHHAGLHVSLKALVEDLYERRLVQVLYCTSTFAMGLNMPARTVCFDAIRKFNGHEVLPLTVRQFMQKAGRAGRRGLDEVGFVVLKEAFSSFAEDEAHIRKFMRGRHERIDSAFNLSFCSVVNLLERHSIDEIRDILDKSFLNFRNRAHIEQERGRLVTGKKELDAALEDPKGLSVKAIKKMEKEVRRLERRLEGAEQQLYLDLSQKVEFLKTVGYIGDDHTFNAGARALMNIQIEEIFVTELLLSGLFEDVSENELFGIFTGVVQDAPRAMTVGMRPTTRWREVARSIRDVKESAVVTGAEALQSANSHFSPELMPLGELWAQGESLNAIMLRIRSETDVAGDLVGAFRRAKDLATQLRQAYRGHDEMTDCLSQLIKKVSRDEVEVLD